MPPGELTELEVWHDNGGLGPGWHLDYIEVHSSATNRVYYFPCGKWLDKKQGDGLIKRRLVATLKVGLCNPAYGGCPRSLHCARSQDGVGHGACSHRSSGKVRKGQHIIAQSLPVTAKPPSHRAM